MIVFSPLSLYTTYLGWQQYDVLFNALWQTGALYLGFLWIGFRFLKNVLAPSGSHYSTEFALNHFLMELTIAFLICAFFVYPCVPLEQKGLLFKPMCIAKNERSITPSTINDTGTTYDEAFADVLSKNVKIPLGFSLLQNYFSSFTYGLIKVTGCTDSLQAINGDLISTYIPFSLRKQALDFHKQCFLEARNAYINDPHDEAETETIKTILKRHGGEEDVNWLGSKTFRTLYYDKLKAREPVTGFSFKNYPSVNFDHAAEDSSVKSHTPTDGFPTCNQWWSKIEKDLVKTFQSAGALDNHLGSLDVTNRIYAYKNKHSLTWNSDLTPEDYIAKMLLHDSRDMQIKSAESLIDPTTNTAGTFISRGLINVGQSFKSMTSTPLKREATLQTLPVMHAFVYFFLIIFSPIVLAFSGYSPRALGSLCGLFMMAILIQYIWHLVSFLERGVLDPLGENGAVNAMRNITVLFYYAAPLILLKLSSHFGGETGSSLAGMLTDSHQTVNDSVKTSSAIAKNGVTVMSAGKVRGF